MPELPEVETTRRALLPYITGQKILDIKIYNPNLRWLVDEQAIFQACAQTVLAVQRRSKYLILQTEIGFLLSHLGMSGHWTIVDNNKPLLKHDHIQIDFTDFCLRYNDARRFGSFQWQQGKAENYAGFGALGVEPIENSDFSYGFDASYLKGALGNKKIPIKPALMDAKIVVGVGNIYANEALFMAGIHPKRLAYRISQSRLEHLSQAIVSVLNEAVKVGGTTLKDFIRPNHNTGYFQLALNVYGRAGEPCHQCQREIKKITQAQRSTFYCANCQT